MYISKKEKQKAKQVKKKEEKQLREDIINFYITKVKALLDDAYVDIGETLEEFNKSLITASLNYNDMKNRIITALRENNEDLLYEATQLAITTEKENDVLFLAITSKKVGDNKILSKLAEVAFKVKDIIDESRLDLLGQKNAEYITSLLIDRCCKQFDEYNQHIIDITMESNEYIDVFVDARDEFIELIKEIKNTIENCEISIAVETIDKTIKHKERLRVTYYELESFLMFKGFVSIRQGNTTHAVWKNKEGISVPVPNKSRTIPQGTVSRILRIIESNRQELIDFLYK